MTEDCCSGACADDWPLKLVPPAVTLLAEGEPVELARLAGAAGWPVARLETVLASFPRLDWDERGRLAGLGLTLSPTPHRYTVGGHALYTWCAMDTLLFPFILGRPAQVTSSCAATRRPVSFTVSPEAVSGLDPATAVVTQLRPSFPVADVRSALCDHVHFFASAAEARGWQAEHPGGEVRPVGEAFAAARRWHEQGGWARSDLP